MSKFDITRHKDYKAHFDQVKRTLTKQIYQDAQSKMKAMMKAQNNKLPTDMQKRLEMQIKLHKKKLKKQAKLDKKRAIKKAQQQLNIAKQTYLRQIQALKSTIKQLEGNMPSKSDGGYKAGHKVGYKAGYDDGYKTRSNEYHPISRHPEFGALMSKYACKDTTGCKPKWLPCPNCNQTPTIPDPPAPKKHKKKRRKKHAKQKTTSSDVKSCGVKQTSNAEPKPYSFGIGMH